MPPSPRSNSNRAGSRPDCHPRHTRTGQVKRISLTDRPSKPTTRAGKKGRDVRPEPIRCGLVYGQLDKLVLALFQQAKRFQKDGSAGKGRGILPRLASLGGRVDRLGGLGRIDAFDLILMCEQRKGYTISNSSSKNPSLTSFRSFYRLTRGSPV